MSANVNNHMTISQEIDKEMVEYEISQAIDYFFILTERRIEAEERKRITSSLVKIIRKFHGDLTPEEVGEAIENGCCEQYGEFTNFDEAIKLIPRFLKAFKKDKEEQRRKERTVVPLAEQERNQVKKGEQVFKDHILLFIKGKNCFIEKHQLSVSPDFCRSSFDAYVRSMREDSEFIDWVMNEFKEKEIKEYLSRRLKQEFERMYKSTSFSPSEYEKTTQYVMNIIAVYQFLKNKGVQFLLKSFTKA